ATEVRSRFLNPKDRRTVFLFGDGACAMYVRDDEAAEGSIEWIQSISLPSDAMEIFVPAGGSMHPLSHDFLAQGMQFIRMEDGPKIVELTTGLLVGEIERALGERRVAATDYDFFVFHQGNAAIAEAVLNALGVSPEKTFANFDRYGNTSSASVGIAL